MNIDEIIKNAASNLAVNRFAEENTPCSKSCTLPNREIIINILEDIKKAIFPGYFDGERLNDTSAEYYEGYLLTEIYRKLKPQIEIALRSPASDTAVEKADSRADEVCEKLISSLPEVRRLLMNDVEAGFNGDPAAQSRAEIIVSYPGLFATFVYRIAHILYVEKVPLIPRIMTEYAHGKTGIDINSGAVIGEYFF
ncbi:MAG: serine acetyltransferase, partial [Clostridia bacterium]|nr:serine acetyltransferase [Clostridia bacterium]